jgi:predicted O-methyltransferase YrrM
MDDVLDYAKEHFVQQSPVLCELYEFALQHEFSHKLTQPLQTQFLCFLLKSIHAKRVIEVGTFLGYTTLAMAQTLPEDGEVVTCEHNETWLNMGKPFWQKAGMEHKISVCLDDALVALQCLLDEGQAGSFDFIYVDAEKRDYPGYLDKSLLLLRPGGIIAFDNVLRVTHGHVADPQTPTTRAIAAFNKLLLARKDLSISLLPMFDGLALVRAGCSKTD